jgi:hypothetical protein
MLLTLMMLPSPRAAIPGASAATKWELVVKGGAHPVKGEPW